MKHTSLQAWLDWIYSLTTKTIDLRLERVKLVAEKLDLLHPQSTIVTVGGTNGKGSTVKTLESMYVTASYRVGAFTSPYLVEFNEQIRLQGENVSDEMICAAFEKVEQYRKDCLLTPFEFITLAAFVIFKEAKLDIWILEVGLGGRLDAVNILDANVSIITSIAIDHAEWLGDTREKIAYEKAGIFRRRCPAVCGDVDPPESLLNYASQIEAPLFCQNKQFGFSVEKNHWGWWSTEIRISDLPFPQLLLQNVATALMAVQILQPKLPVSTENIKKALKNLSLPGRLQYVPGRVPHIFDVSHNPASVLVLAKYLSEYSIEGKTIAIFSMLADKDIQATVDGIKHFIDEWHIAPLKHERAASLSQLQEALIHQKVVSYDDIWDAYQGALLRANAEDRLVVFGSFYTVGIIQKNRALI